jgi:hypothetical protein
MPKLETKTMTVHPTQEDKAIDFMQNFGWGLKNNQEIYNKDTRMEDDFWSDGINVITETTHYIKLTFQRDTSTPNYSRLAELERSYNAIEVNPTEKKPSILNTVLICTSVYLSIIMFEQHVIGTGSTAFFYVGSVGMIAGTVAPVYFHVKKKKAYNNAYNNADSIASQKKQEILRECERLIS